MNTKYLIEHKNFLVINGFYSTIRETKKNVAVYRDWIERAMGGVQKNEVLKKSDWSKYSR